MSFRCSICSEAYTASGTEHAICSTKCGHLFGKSCLKKWASEKNVEGKFMCPVCRQSLRDYFPIYDVPNELLGTTLNEIKDKWHNEDDILRRCILGTLGEKHFFIEKEMVEHEDLNKKTIEFSDASNGYILIAGYDEFKFNDSYDYPNDDYDRIYFLKVYDGEHVCYSKNFRSIRITAVAVYKYSKDGIEYCVGLENGNIHNTVFYLTNGDRETPHENILFNENKDINSICYLGQNDIVYSVEHCHIFNVHTDVWILKKIG
uniref:RING-type domain-containing protein n=1 Tax=Strongyloides papillosus TaxID=174720 RepID=A0A0N5BAR3_STREA